MSTLVCNTDVLTEVADYDVRALQAQEHDWHTACRTPGPRPASGHAASSGAAMLAASTAQGLTLAGVAVARRARAGLVDASLVGAALGEGASLRVRPGGLVGVGGLVVGCATSCGGSGHLLAPKEAALLLDGRCVLRPGESHTQQTSAPPSCRCPATTLNTLEVRRPPHCSGYLGQQAQGIW